MAKKSVSELEKRTVNAMTRYIACYPGIETKLLRGYLALQLLTENGRLPYSFKGVRLTKLPTARQIIAMLRRNRRVYWANDNPFLLCWYVKDRETKRILLPLREPRKLFSGCNSSPAPSAIKKEKYRAGQLMWKGSVVLPKSSPNISVAVPPPLS